jgi:hypothetical protein
MSGEFFDQTTGIYIGGSVALEGAAMDLYNGIIGKNSSTLEVACGPPGIGAKKVQGSSETSFELLT